MAKKLKIEITSCVTGKVLFEYEAVGNTIKKTVEEAIAGSADLRYASLRSADLSSANLSFASLRFANLSSADLSSADLSSADLSSANLSFASLRFADLSSANLRFANLGSADLRSANLRFANLGSADLRSANLSDIPFNQLPESWVNLCSRDILFVLEHLKNEVPFLKERLLAGKVDGTQYEGECACLIGSLAKSAGKDKDNVCTSIPFYQLGTYNPGEQWFLHIKEGDTPKDNVFSKHAVELCNQALGLPLDDGLDLEEEPQETADEEVETIELNGKKYRLVEGVEL